MVRKFVAGNWKQNTNLEEALQLTQEIQSKIPEGVDDRVILFPPIIHMAYLKKVFPNLKFGAQDCSQYNGGAYTGEISADMIQSVGGDFVLVGHSERREYFEESSETLFKKMENGLRSQPESDFLFRREALRTTIG